MIALLLTLIPLAFPQNTSPVQAIRSKLSAGDLPSAESILEVYRLDKGKDANYLEGLAWVARGAVLNADWDKAKRYAAETRQLADEQLKAGKTLDKDRAVEGALGSAIEVEAQVRAAKSGKRDAARYVAGEIVNFPSAPITFRSRLYKRLNMLGLEGRQPPSFAEIQIPRGKPAMLFFWAHWCGDCRAQVAAVGKVRQKYASTDLTIIAPTRLYDAKQPVVEKVWNETYKPLAGIPMPINDKIMERYGVSSTPTFVFIDRDGKVRRYLPSRLTEVELSRQIDAILR